MIHCLCDPLLRSGARGAPAALGRRPGGDAGSKTPAPGLSEGRPAPRAPAGPVGGGSPAPALPWGRAGPCGESPASPPTDHAARTCAPADRSRRRTRGPVSGPTGDARSKRRRPGSEPAGRLTRCGVPRPGPKAGETPVAPTGHEGRARRAAARPCAVATARRYRRTRSPQVAADGLDAPAARRYSALMRWASSSWSSRMTIRHAASIGVPWSTSSRARAAMRSW